MYLRANDNQLANYFKHCNCEIIETSGINDGTILKFDTFYLKIYDAENSSTYNIQKYMYGCNQPVSVDDVPYNRMREYISRL